MLILVALLLLADSFYVIVEVPSRPHVLFYIDEIRLSHLLVVESVH